MSHYTKLITLLLIGSLSLNAYLLWPQKQPVVGTQKTHSGKSIKAPKGNLLSQAQQQFTQHKFDDALNTYQQLNLNAPKKAHTLYASWVAQLKQWLNTNLPLSQSLLNALLNKDPYNTELLTLHVDYLVKSGQRQNAIIALFELYPLLNKHQQGPVDKRLVHLTTNELHSLSEQQNWQTIIEQTQIWLDYQNDNSHFLYALAHAYYQLEDFISALTTIERMPSNHPLQAEVTALHAMIEKAQSQDDFIALTPYGAHYLISTELNSSIKTELMIDTGASITSLSSDVLNQLSPRPLYLGDVTVNTANGQIRVKRYQIESFKVGMQTIYGFEVLSIENTRGQGLLGMNFLSRFKFNINQQTDELELSAK